MSLINDELIKALKIHTPEKENTVDLLMNITPLGREAAYRRLRGEIPFTLSEAAVICKEFNLSLDLLIGSSQKDTHAFHLNAIFGEKPMDEYALMLTGVYNQVKYMIENEPHTFSYRAYRGLPQEFMYKYDSLSKIYIYILIYQLYLQSSPKGLFEIQIPDKIFSLHKSTASVMEKIDSILIMDKRIFVEYIEIVKYFYGLGIVSDEEIAEIKKDLHLMLNDLEKCAITGKTPSQKKLDVYISNISFDCTYTYLEGSDFQACSVGIYCINHLTCTKPSITQNHKLWIKSLIRFSTLISVSGELQRNDFFNKQRNFINTLL